MNETAGVGVAMSKSSKNDLVIKAEQYRLGRLIVVTLGVPTTILSLWLPLQAVREIVEAVAGKTTDISIVVKVTIGVTVALTLTMSAAVAKLITQRRELRRLRNRVSELERRLLAFRRQQESLPTEGAPG